VKPFIYTHLGAIAVVAAAVCVPATAQAASESQAAAKTLTDELGRRGITVVAAKDPNAEAVFVAATYIPGVELLVVSARSTAPAYLDQLLAWKQFDQVYASLNGASLPDGKLFIQDMRADGLTPSREDGGTFDIVYQDVTKTTMFDGNWKKQNLSEAEYRSRFAQVDGRYAKVLSLLLAQLRSEGHPLTPAIR
jgi:hypothetical protein